MRPVDALVAKVVADLVHAVEAADHQPLEIQLIGDAHEERHVERVVMRREGPRRRSTVLGLQYGRLHLEKIAPVEKAPDRRRHPRPRDEQRANLRMHRKIGVPLTVALFGVRESRVPHRHAIHYFFLAVWQWPQRLRQQLDGADANCHLARPRSHERTRRADNVADVVEIELREQRLAQLVLPEVELDPATAVGEVRESSLAVATPRDESASHPDDTSFLGPLRQRGHCIRRLMRPVVAIRKRRHTGGDQCVELLASRLLHEVELVRHAAPTVLSPPDRLRNASMNGSIPPSITFWTSGIFNSVR